jgi:hypothetical protein
MNDESRQKKEIQRSGAFGFLDAGDKGRSEFLGLLLEWLQFVPWYDFALNEELKPVGSFVEFLKRNFEFANELRS